MRALPMLVLVFIPAVTSAQVASGGNAGSMYFDQALRSLRSGQATDAAASAEKGWAALLAAGPTSSDFIRGVYDASGLFGSLGSPIRAEALCAAQGLQLLKLRLQYMHADHLIRNSEYVKAEGILRDSLAIENRMPEKSSLYVAFLQNLAFVREQQGDLAGAEALYRMTIGYPSPDLSGVITPMFAFGKQRLPLVGEPRSAMAIFYSNHGRIKEAEALCRELLAEPSLNGEERIAAMRQLVDFLRTYGSKTEALTIEEQIIELRKKQPLTTPELRDRLANERYTLANLEVDAGRGDDAKALLESDLRQAEAYTVGTVPNTQRRSTTSLRTVVMPTITSPRKSWLARKFSAQRAPILPSGSGSPRLCSVWRTFLGQKARLRSLTPSGHGELS